MPDRAARSAGRDTDGEQLPLSIEPSPRHALPARLRPMQSIDGDRPFDDPDWFFEPWWPGAAALAYVEDFRARLQLEHLADPSQSPAGGGHRSGCYPGAPPQDGLNATGSIRRS